MISADSDPSAVSKDGEIETAWHQLRSINIADEAVTKMQAANAFTVCQNGDETLNHYRGLAVQGSSEFIIDKGRLYKSTPATVHSLHEKLLVVPREYRRQI